MSIALRKQEQEFQQLRRELAVAFRWTARLGMHEAVANHFSLAVDETGTKFLMNPNQVHFSRLKASSMLLLDANDRDVLKKPDAPDVAAWALHGAVHRRCKHAKCVMHLHSTFATVLASLADSTLPPIDLNTATFFNRHVVDDALFGIDLEEEGERCVGLLQDPKIKVMIMSNHGVMVLGESVADAFNRMYYFERAAENYIRALQTGKALRVLADDVAEKLAAELENYPGQVERHFAELTSILDEEGSDYAR